MADKILIIDHIEDIHDKDGGIAGKECFDSTGASVKVKVGREGFLKNRWEELQVGKAYSFTMGEYKGFPFVQDFKSVESVFVKEAQKQVEDSTVTERRRSMALSYAKDWGIGKLPTTPELKTVDIITIAILFESYIENGATVKKQEP